MSEKEDPRYAKFSELADQLGEDLDNEKHEGLMVIKTTTDGIMTALNGDVGGVCYGLMKVVENNPALKPGIMTAAHLISIKDQTGKEEEEKEEKEKE